MAKDEVRIQPEVEAHAQRVGVILPVAGLLSMMFGADAAAAPGVAARFLGVTPVEGQPLEVRLEVEDDTGAVEHAVVELRREGAKSWHARSATAAPSGVFHVWFDQALLPPAGGRIELRAVLLGARGGLLLELGGEEPLALNVATAARGMEEKRHLARGAQANAFSIAGYVGVEGRAQSGARVRALIGVGASLGSKWELLGSLSVGPAFARPPALSAGGPMTLGAELALRHSLDTPATARWVVFGDLCLGADLRLPGLDPGAGARIGASYGLGAGSRIEASLGGMLMIFGAAGDPASTVGATAGLRLLLRFESPREAAEG